MKKTFSILLALITISGCNIFSNDSEVQPTIDYRVGQSSQYHYTLSARHADSTQFDTVRTQVIYTDVINTDAEIIVEDTLLSNLINMKLTVEDKDTTYRLKNVWYRYDNGYFSEYAYTFSNTGGLLQPKMIQNPEPHYKLGFIEHLNKFSPERMIIGNFYGNDSNINSTNLRSNPRLVHPDVFKIGMEWTTFSENGSYVNEITNKKDITVDNRQYNSFEIETYFFRGSYGFTYHSYFDSHGLVKRIIEADDQTLVDDAGNVIFSGASTRSVLERISFSE